MWKQRAVTTACVLGLASLVGGCMVDVDDPVVEDVASQQQGVVEMARLPPRFLPRFRRPNPIDPGGRLLACLVDPNKQYVSRDPEFCARIRFFCTEGRVPFFDRCGCGCAVDNASEEIDDSGD